MVRPISSIEKLCKVSAAITVVLDRHIGLWEEELEFSDKPFGQWQSKLSTSLLSPGNRATTLNTLYNIEQMLTRHRPNKWLIHRDQVDDIYLEKLLKDLKVEHEILKAKTKNSTNTRGRGREYNTALCVERLIDRGVRILDWLDMLAKFKIKTSDESINKETSQIKRIAIKLYGELCAILTPIYKTFPNFYLSALIKRFKKWPNLSDSIIVLNKGGKILGDIGFAEPSIRELQNNIRSQRAKNRRRMQVLNL